jgi:hypothetical protein
MGDAPSRYSATVGAGTFHARNILAETLIDDGRLEEAAAHLEHVLEHYPDFVGAVEPYVRVLLRSGVPAAEVVGRMAELVPAPTPSQRFLLAVPFYEAGAVSEAAVELRAVLAAQPGAHAARVALAETQLSQGDLAAAAQTAQAVPVDALHAPAAAQTAVFARLAAGDDAAALDEAFAYARAAGLDGAQLAALTAWRGDADAPATVPAAAAQPLAVMLEALARLEAFDAFERLAGVVEKLDVPWREQRELMAGVYYRRGFLESAAREWFGVVDRLGGPDERALLGMAMLAEVQGLGEDAALLRAEAATLAQAAA